jgi:ubiquinone/menaquinone biosynthesis C-methylase UbiE
VTTSEYTLANTWEKARRRVSLIEELYDDTTTARLSRLGVRPGWQCLEVGAGGGSIARWMCDQVGPSGRVVAVDFEPRFLAADPRPNLEIVQRDVTAEELPGDGYHLIHARALLVHLANRDELVHQMARRLRPGGVLLLEEPDLAAGCASGSPTYVRVNELACAAVAKKGNDWFWPAMLPTKLVAAGLVEVAGAATTELYNGGSSMAEFWALTIEQITPMVLAEGATEELLAAFMTELADPGQWFPSFALTRAWGRRVGSISGSGGRRAVPRAAG